MLEYIKGSVSQVSNAFLVIETGGIGIKVLATQNTIKKIGEQNPESVFLLTYLHITENKWEVFGFSDEKEREAFLLLLDCRGVGTKAAINILSNFSPSRLRGVALGDEPVTILQQVPGIGAKSADRILVELKEKLPEMNSWGSVNSDKKRSPGQYSQEDISRALKNLGYREAEIRSAISRIPDLPATLSEAVKELLKSIGNK